MIYKCLVVLGVTSNDSIVLCSFVELGLGNRVDNCGLGLVPKVEARED